MTLKDIFAKAPSIDCANIDNLPTAQAKLIASIPDLVIGDSATIGYIDARGDYYCPDLECDVDRAPLDAEFLRRVCLENTETARYVSYLVATG